VATIRENRPLEEKKRSLIQQIIIASSSWCCTTIAVERPKARDLYLAHWQRTGTSDAVCTLLCIKHDAYGICTATPECDNASMQATPA
jgi:hypothetical protein